MSVPWRDDPPGARERLHNNLGSLLDELTASAQRRDRPTVELARAWHRAIFAGVELPVTYYAGGIRDRDPDEPELVDHEVLWGGRPATAAAAVWDELRAFERAAVRAINALDDNIPARGLPANVGALESVLAAAAVMHNEWVRIHPHVNGNGRIARCWTNWVLTRYGVPPVMRLMPRPENALYARAAALSRQRAHGPMQRYIHYLVRVELARPSE